MMRSLWTAASGMTSQQLNVDTISNNLANVNTTAYKKERLEFKSLLYQTMERADLDPASERGKPINLQVGLGVKPIATNRIYTPGNFETTGLTFDMAIEGNGFFKVDRGNEEICYTKDGALKISLTEEGQMLVTSEGYPILSTDDEPIIFDDTIILDNISIDPSGTMNYVNNEGEFLDLDMQIKLVQFNNIKGLEAIGSNLFKTTAASGAELSEADEETNNISRIVQGVVEMSNVQVAEEMVRMIVAQRAYELNSKAIQTSDNMLETANNLKR